MPTFLLTWNPDQYDWNDPVKEPTAEETYEKVALNRATMVTWSCSNSKKIRKRDRLFLLKQGSQGRGIVASGYAAGDWYLGEDWRATGSDAHYVDMTIDAMVNPRGHEVLDIGASEIPALAKLSRRRNSGTEINPGEARALEALWTKHLTGGHSVPGAGVTDAGAEEGERRQRLLWHRKRERQLRRDKLDEVLIRDGVIRCEVPGCGFDFGIVYGSLGGKRSAGCRIGEGLIVWAA